MNSPTRWPHIRWLGGAFLMQPMAWTIVLCQFTSSMSGAAGKSLEQEQEVPAARQGETHLFKISKRMLPKGDAIDSPFSWPLKQPVHASRKSIWYNHTETVKRWRTIELPIRAHLTVSGWVILASVDYIWPVRASESDGWVERTVAWENWSVHCSAISAQTVVCQANRWTDNVAIADVTLCSNIAH